MVAVAAVVLHHVAAAPAGHQMSALADQAVAVDMHHLVAAIWARAPQVVSLLAIAASRAHRAVALIVAPAAVVHTAEAVLTAAHAVAAHAAAVPIAAAVHTAVVPLAVAARAAAVPVAVEAMAVHRVAVDVVAEPILSHNTHFNVKLNQTI